METPETWEPYRKISEARSAVVEAAKVVGAVYGEVIAGRAKRAALFEAAKELHQKTQALERLEREK